MTLTTIVVSILTIIALILFALLLYVLTHPDHKE